MNLIAVVLIIALLLALVVISVAVGFYLARQSGQRDSTQQEAALDQALDQALDVVRHERGEAMQGALETVLSVASSKLGDQLDAGKSVIDRERDLMSQQVDGVQAELRRVQELVIELQKERAEQSGQLQTGLEQAFKVTTSLADTTRSLERALASPKARGQWGERMAEDVLSAAGFVEGVSYRRQTKLSTGRVPDYTFMLPHGHAVHMDVKFPIDNYLRWQNCDDDAARARHAKQFQVDVRQRINELGERGYVDSETTVDYLLLFVPNESVYGFLHEHDDTVIDYAVARKVVLCSPTTLFAVLAVVRQAVDNFLVERKSDDILGALGGLREQWDRWQEPMDKMRRGLSSAQKAFDDLAGPRTRQFNRQLEKLESLRDTKEITTDSDTNGKPTGDTQGNDDDHEAQLDLDQPATLRQVI